LSTAMNEDKIVNKDTDTGIVHWYHRYRYGYARFDRRGIGMNISIEYGDIIEIVAVENKNST
jgi:hypothetical protein